MKIRKKANVTRSLPKITFQNQPRFITQKNDEEELDFSFELYPENPISAKQEFYRFHKTIERIYGQEEWDFIK